MNHDECGVKLPSVLKYIFGVALGLFQPPDSIKPPPATLTPLQERNHSPGINSSGLEAITASFKHCYHTVILQLDHM